MQHLTKNLKIFQKHDTMTLFLFHFQKKVNVFLFLGFAILRMSDQFYLIIVKPKFGLDKRTKFDLFSFTKRRYYVDFGDFAYLLFR